MISQLNIRFQELHLPFKTTFRHASASRKVGESVWVEAARNGTFGYGEGCPRPYVTGESVQTCMAWFEEHVSGIQRACTSIDALKDWIEINATTLDENPSAWCAIESALLDLFAQENGVSVEGLLNQGSPQARYAYTAVMGDDEERKYKLLLDFGGVLRALALVDTLKEKTWPIIVGAHVGETSVLKRAAMCVARAAGENLIAQEGGFGANLVEYEPAQPRLCYGHNGILDLRQGKNVDRSTGRRLRAHARS